MYIHTVSSSAVLPSKKGRRNYNVCLVGVLFFSSLKFLVFFIFFVFSIWWCFSFFGLQFSFKLFSLLLYPLYFFAWFTRNPASISLLYSPSLSNFLPFHFSSSNSFSSFFPVYFIYFYPCTHFYIHTKLQIQV